MAENKLRVCRVQRIGTSLGITLPAEFLRSLGVVRGELLRVSLVGKSITVESLNETSIKTRRAPNSRGPGEFLGKS